MQIKTHIYRMGLWALLLLSCVYANAQLTARVGDTTQLSVHKDSSESYVWELYDSSQGVDFAQTAGNCPKTKAVFVGKNTGNSVTVKWLQEGDYFYKVTATGSCSNNIKLGHIKIAGSKIPKPLIEVTYDCEKGIAMLAAKEYSGKLRWSTGATTSTITVKEKGTYSLVQIVDDVESIPQTVEVAQITPEAPKVVLAKPVGDGSQVELYAELSDGSTAHWYADKELTEEVTTLVPSSEETVYYLVVESAAGCLGEPIPLIIGTNIHTEDFCHKLFLKLEINQLVTPNGDGVNDSWELVNLLDYCKKCQKVAKVTLFNRGGMKVYEKSGNLWLDEPFEGYSDNSLTYRKDELLPSGTYFYMIKVAGEDYKVGYIHLTY